MTTRYLLGPALVFLLATCSCGNPNAESGGDGGVAITTHLGISFPPMGTTEQRAFSAEHLEALHVTRIRFEDHWSLRQTSEGAPFVWDGLDAKLDYALLENLSVLLTVGVGIPSWACDPDRTSPRTCVPSNLESFSAYVDALLDHLMDNYGRLPFERIQFGNEWLSDFWYPGSGDDFVAQTNIVYDAVKARSPETTVVLGSLSTSQIAHVSWCLGRVDRLWTSMNNTFPGQYLESSDRDASCNTPEADAGWLKATTVYQNARYDEVDQHLYDDAENWPTYLATLREELIPSDRSAVEVIVSEFGGPNTWIEPDTDDHQAERVALYISTLSAEDVRYAYFFSLVERPDDSTDGPAFHNRSGLIRDGELTTKPSYFVFARHAEGQR